MQQKSDSTANIRWDKRLTFSALALVALATTSFAAGPQPAEKMDKAVRSWSTSAKTSTISVIVQLKNGVNDLVRRDLARLRADLGTEYTAIDAVQVKLASNRLNDLAALTYVKRVSIDATVEKTDAFTISGTLTDTAWKTYAVNGNGVGVAVVDSGVALHPDLNGRYENVNFATDNVTTLNGDPCGHGTHVAGLIGGNSNMASGTDVTQNFFGTAPSASIVSVRVLDSNGRGAVSNALAGLQWVFDHQSDRKLRVVNISFGHDVVESYTTDPLCLMVEKLWKSGLVVVVAAGNNGRYYSSPMQGVDNEGYGSNYGSITSPGNDPYVITVGAMKRLTTARVGDRVTTYSSRGPSQLDHIMKPDIMAPGNKVISLGWSTSFLNTTYSSTNGVAYSEYISTSSSRYQNAMKLNTLLGGAGESGTYFRMNGTSMAAPVVSGIAALMIQKTTSLKPDTVKARLMFSATKWADASGVYDPCSMGAGYVDASAALKSTITVTLPALSPRITSDTKGVWVDYKSLMGTSGSIWGSKTIDPRVIWGSRALWGSTTKASTTTTWTFDSAVLGGTRAVWGHTQLADTRAVWGNGTPACDLTSIAISGE